MAEITKLKVDTLTYADIFQKKLEEREKLLTTERTRIHAKYGAVIDDDIDKILNAEKELEQCKNCDGEICQHKFLTGCIPVIEVSEHNFADGNKKLCADISYKPCKKKQMKDRQKKYQRTFQNAKLPPQYVNKTFEDYKIDVNNKSAVKTAKDFLKDYSTGIFYYGNTGTGKTFLAAIIAQEYLKQGNSVIFGDVPSLLDDLRESYGSENNFKITKMMEDLTETDLLVLDDLGTESQTERAVERLYLIINQRYNADKLILVTSNFKLGEIAERMNNPKNASNNFPSVTGDRIVSRLAQMCKRVELTGEDRRF